MSGSSGARRGPRNHRLNSGRLVRPAVIALAGLMVLATASVVVASVGLPIAPSHSVLVVDGDGRASAANCGARTPAFTTIQSAIDAAGGDATIRVCPGVYAESLVIAGDRLHGLTLVSTRLFAARIRPVGTRAIAVRGVVGVTISGFGIRPRGRVDAAGTCHPVTDAVLLRDAGATLLRDRFFGDSRCGVETGLEMRSSVALVQRSVFRDVLQDGVAIVDGSRGAVLDSIFRDDFAGRRLALPGNQPGSDTTAVRVEGAGAAIRRNLIVGTIGDPAWSLAEGVRARDSAVVVARNQVNGTRSAGIDVECSTVSCGGATTAQRAPGPAEPAPGAATTPASAAAATTPAPASAAIVIRGNKVSQSGWGGGPARAGIRLVAVSGALVRNNFLAQDGAGFAVDARSRGNRIEGNTAWHSAGWDCRDASHGTGTGGTANAWINDAGMKDLPTAICAG